MYREKKNRTNSFTPCSVSCISYFVIFYPVALCFTLCYIIYLLLCCILLCPFRCRPFLTLIFPDSPCALLPVSYPATSFIYWSAPSIAYPAISLLSCSVPFYLYWAFKKWRRYMCLAYILKHGEESIILFNCKCLVNIL